MMGVKRGRVSYDGKATSTTEMGWAGWNVGDDWSKQDGWEGWDGRVGPMHSSARFVQLGFLSAMQTGV